MTRARHSRRVRFAMAAAIATFSLLVLPVSPAAGLQAPPPYRLLVTDQSPVSLPATLGRPSYDNLDAAGDFLFAAGGSSVIFIG